MHRFLRAISAIAILCLAGCQSLPHSVHDFCTLGKPILVSKQDVLTDGTAKQIQSHDETGAKLCGWE